MRDAVNVWRIIFVMLLSGVFGARAISVPVHRDIASAANLNQGEGVEPTASVATEQKLFDFRSGFWINLHHFLYLQAVLATPESRKARAEESARSGAGGRDLSAAQKAIWDKAVQFYLQYGKKDALSDRELVAVNYELSDAGNSTTLKDRHLSPALMATLEDAAPVYRAVWWSDHDRRNRDWITSIAKLVREYGTFVSQRIEKAFQIQWPAEKTTAEVVEYANWAGAYTVTNSTLITIASTDLAGQGEAGLENLFHEASHALVGNLQRQLDSDIRAAGKTPNFDIVHVMIFYTAGAVTSEALGKNGRHDFTPYAVKNGLYERVANWKRYRDVCDNDWRPYLEGKTTFDAALAQIAKDF